MMTNKSKIKTVLINKKLLVVIFIFFTAISLLVLSLLKLFFLRKQVIVISSREASSREQLIKIGKELDNLENQDQYLINKELETEVKNIQSTYQSAVSSYEKLLDLKGISKETDKLDEMFADSLTFLSQRKYTSAAAVLANLDSQILREKEKVTASFQIPQNLTNSSQPPSAGYQRQVVQTDAGAFMVDIVSADLNSTRVIVDTASDSNCSNDCPVKSLSEYAGRGGAYAGINGSYFCPASYPSCSDKKNSFDTLLMNKNKVYFNSDNNVYSNVPAVIFSGNSARFVSRSLEWGRDTSVDAVIANQPLLTLNGQIVFAGDDEAKRASKGNRSFIGNTRNMAYIGVVHNASVIESAKVINALGISNALNLDNGGSTALWFSGYKVGPGRDIPNCVLFVRK